MYKLLRMAAGPLLLGSAVIACAAPPARHHLITGGVYEDKGPDGNTIILDAPDGLIVVDTGRHPEHAAKILAYADTVGKPVAAIINSHWHLDHTTGNMDVLKAHAGAAIVTSRAIEGKLFENFITPSRTAAKQALADGTAPERERPAMIRGQSFLDQPRFGRATRPVEKSGRMEIAGRVLDVRLAPFAATEGDVWLVVPEEQLVIAGDLVVDIVPFMDTACVQGWAKALDDIAAVDFDTLIPGHGAPMTKPQFLTWKSAFDRLVECGASAATSAQCADGWLRDAAPFIGAEHLNYAKEAAVYYLDSRVRSKPEERERYCAVPKG